jgi:glycerate dehydrogenase
MSAAFQSWITWAKNSDRLPNPKHQPRMHRIVFLERNTFNANIRRPSFDHEWIEYGETRADEVVERLRGATIVISNKLALREPDLSRLPDLKLIAIAATGTDNVDLNYCKTHGITVINTRNYSAQSLPEHVLMLILALRKNLFSYREAVKRGEWQKSKQFCLLKYPIKDLYGSTLGIIGYGFLGKAVGMLAEGVGMNVLVSEHKDAEEIRAGRVSFEQVLRESDVVTLHCPLTEKTRNMIDEREFQLMKPNALLINAARGGLVNENALVKALQDGVIAGAGFDVLTNEPPVEGNPLLELELPNLIITPHVAWASNEAMQTLADQLIDNIEAFVSGEPKNVVV